ncbi:MAG: BrnA antitoxin family protein [Alphaproteobacteria bacterium]|nr:BrnA antitoxin family protein [Alphaproteobacteria bacterium]
MRPASEVVPGVVAAWKRTRGRPKSETTKIATSIRLDADVLAHFKATGTGWQTRINQALRKAARM